jgi:hypothetical protein
VIDHQQQYNPERARHFATVDALMVICFPNSVFIVLLQVSLAVLVTLLRAQAAMPIDFQFSCL